MTIEEFHYLVDLKKEYEFSFRNKTYNLTYGKDEKGDYIKFGLLYEELKYYSLGEFLNTCKLENSYFREVLSILPFR